MIIVLLVTFVISRLAWSFLTTHIYDTSTLFQDQCCWVCVACREDAYVDNDTCKTCLPGYAPNENGTGCEKLIPTVLEWTSPWVLTPLIFSTIGIIFTIFTTCVFIHFNKTPVIMASGRELCYVLLCGTFSCFAMSFVILATPTIETCATMRIGLGLCLSLCYSAIFTKTNRISRIFNRGVKSIKRPVYTSPISQVAIALGEHVMTFKRDRSVWTTHEKKTTAFVRY